MSTPMQDQYNQIKQKHPDAVVLFRLGDFYEAFDDDAVKISKILGITLTGRGKDENRRNMAGIPHHALENYLPKLMHAGCKVALAEQLTDPKAGQIVERDVVRVFTPGTYTDDKNLADSQNLYIAAIHISINPKKYYLALLDISTGYFGVEEFENFARLKDKVLTHNAAEVLVSNEYKNLDIGFASNSVEYIDKGEFDLNRAFELLLRHFRTQTLKGFGFDTKENSLIAAGIVLRYAKENYKTGLEHVKSLKKIGSSEHMHMDFATIRNLELVYSMSANSVGPTLFSVLCQCATAMGKRLLKNWILAPLVDKQKIEKRLVYVDWLYAQAHTSDAITKYLSQILDTERITARIGTKTINPRDLIALKNSLESLKEIGYLLKQEGLNVFENFINLFEKKETAELISLIEVSINPDPPVKFDNAGVIAVGYNREIDELREIKNNTEAYLLDLQTRERKATGIESLKVKFNKVFGYYIEITKTNSTKAPAHYIRKQTLVNAERYIIPELKEYEEKALTAEEKLIALEQRLFAEIIDKIAINIEFLQKVSSALAYLDVVNNFAQIARERKYVRPELVSYNNMIELKNSRHPVVEIIKKQSYIPNDVNLTPDANFVLLTGPNMAGKSTFIRQVALVILMSQIGSYVPCDSARLSVFDRIFTRVGASDNLAAGESTFMVEMSETSNILNNATHNSLIILDEIGRGTSTYDGVAIAWSIVEYIHDHLKATALFATHYHELINLDAKLDRVKNFHVYVDERGDEIIFSHKIKPGGMGKSYGIHVAEMAGIPGEVIKNARGILKRFEGNSQKIKTQKGSIQPPNIQLGLF